MMDVDSRKARAIKFAFNDHLPIAEIAGRLEVSERTIYRWKRGYLNSGPASLMRKSRRPKVIKNKTSLEVEQLVVEAKLKNPSYGARRLHWYLKDNHNIAISHMTIARILKRRGIAIRIKPKNQHLKRFERKHANSLWQLDVFYFRIAGVGRVYLFAMIDDYSRYCIASKLFRDKEAINSLLTLACAIKKYGKPKQLLTDNGKEVTELMFENYLAKKKIKHSRSRPYSPWSKGKIEAFWKIVHRELITKVEFSSLQHARKELRKFIKSYNFKRRHGGIGWQVPASRYFNKRGDNNID